MERVSEDEQRDTAAALFGFIDEKARSDMDLREEEVSILHVASLSTELTWAGDLCEPQASHRLETIPCWTSTCTCTCTRDHTWAGDMHGLEMYMSWRPCMD